jgi:prepilin-type N-terminal cleavage/methylation domain-containing protein
MKKISLSSKIKAGFSLLELLVVVAIIGILAAIGTIGYGNYINSTKKAALDTNRENLSKLLATELSANETKDNSEKVATCYQLIENIVNKNNKSSKNVFTGTAEPTYINGHNHAPYSTGEQNAFTFTQGHYFVMCANPAASPAETQIITCSCENDQCQTETDPAYTGQASAQANDNYPCPTPRYYP